MPESKPHSDRLYAIRTAWVDTYDAETDNEPLLKAAREDMRWLVEQYEGVHKSYTEALAEVTQAWAAYSELKEQLESVKRDGLRLRERLNQAEAFIDHLDANYRYEEWLGEEHEDASNPARSPDA